MTKNVEKGTFSVFQNREKERGNPMINLSLISPGLSGHLVLSFRLQKQPNSGSQAYRLSCKHVRLHVRLQLGPYWGDSHAVVVSSTKMEKMGGVMITKKKLKCMHARVR